MKRRLTHGEVVYEQENDISPPTSTMNDVTARMISSSVGSIVTALAVTPLDVAKVRLQNSAPPTNHRLSSPFYHNKGLSHCCCGTLVWKDSSSVRRNMSSYVARHSATSAESSSPATAAREANTTWLMLRKIWLEEGISGLYRGIRPTLIMSVPSTMLYFTCYDELVQHVRAGLPAQAQAYAPLLAGGTARWLASSATAPLEYMRTREASLSGANHGTSLVQIIRSEGVRSLYRGLAPTLWRDVPFSAIYWLAIEEMRGLWSKQNGGAPASVTQQFAQSFVNGLVAGTISACCTTPFDVIKTRQQSAVAKAATCNHGGATPFGSAQAPGTLRALQQLARSEGVAGLWRGNWARVAKVAPSCAIMISSYEVGKRLLTQASG